MGSIVAVVNEFYVYADSAVVTLDEPENTQDATFADTTEGKRTSCFGKVTLDFLAEADGGFLKILWFVITDLPDDEVDKAHGEHVVGEKCELIFLFLVVCFEGVPQESEVFLLVRGLEGKREVISQFEGIFQRLSTFRDLGFTRAPHAGEGGLDLFLEALQ